MSEATFSQNTGKISPLKAFKSSELCRRRSRYLRVKSEEENNQCSTNNKEQKKIGDFKVG